MKLPEVLARILAASFEKDLWEWVRPSSPDWVEEGELG